MIALRSAMHRVSLNTVWLFASRVISQGLSAITVILLARMLGADGLGQYAFATSIIFVVNALTTFGTDTLIIREVARDASAAPRWLTASLTVQLTFSLTGIVIIWLAFDSLALRLYSLALIPLSISTAYSAILRGSERMDAYMLFTVVVAMAQLIGIAVIFTIPADLTSVMLVLIAAQMIGAGLALIVARTLPEFYIDTTILRRILITGLPLVLLMVLSLLSQRMGIFALSIFADDASTGHYSAAMRIIEACKLLPAASLGALFPVWARRESRAVGRIEAMDARLLGYAILAAVIIHLLAGGLIPTLFGAEYRAAVPILRLLGWSLIPYVLAATLSLRLVAAHRERSVLAAMCITVPISLILFAILIGHSGLYGAGLTVLISETLQAAILLILVWRT